MKKIICLLVLMITVLPLFAGATVKEFFGKVKVKYDGDTSWSSIEVGQELPDNTLVSTGFNSQIVLDLGNSTLDVLPLTRMTIAEITESSDTIKTELLLQGGKIKADVGKVEGKVNDFLIKSPVATASVRGTAFEFSGNTLTVIRGEVAFAPTKKEAPKAAPAQPAEGEEQEEEEVQEEPSQPAVSVKAGGQTQMSGPQAKPAKPGDMAINKSAVATSTKPEVKKNKGTDPGPGQLGEAPKPGDVQAQVTGPVNVTIKITPVE